MFHVYGIAGHLFSGKLEQIRQAAPVGAVARVRAASAADPGDPAATATATDGRARAALAAYGGGASRGRDRQPLQRAEEVMTRPAFMIGADTSVRSAWRALDQRGVAQAPVVGAGGALVGLVGRAELLPGSLLEPAVVAAGAWEALLARPVSEVMWTPVPAAEPDTELRRVAELLIGTGLPGVPVATPDGQVLGFVSRSDLLRALVADPPLDVWG